MHCTLNHLKLSFLFYLVMQILFADALAGEASTQKASDEKAMLGSIWSAIRDKLGHTANENMALLERPEQPTDKKLLQIEPEQKQKQEEHYTQEKLPSQMAPIEKAVVYLRPKANERWVIKEEGSIIWAVSNVLQSKSNNMFMNCNLYQGDRMLLSVFKGVPLIVGTESWTPPVFLKPAPDYRLRLWSQPSEAGIIDEYSAEFSMVPRADDAYMFSYNNSVVMDNSNTALSPDTRIRIDEYSLPLVNESEYSGIMLGVNNNNNNHSPTASFSDPNIPMSIYALYPSDSWRLAVETYLSILVIVTGFFVVFILSI